MSLSRNVTGREFQKHGPATENSFLRDAFVFFLWHTSRHQPIAVIGGRYRSRADNLQPGTVDAWPCKIGNGARQRQYYCRPLIGSDMACRITEIPMTLSDLQVDIISTDSVLRGPSAIAELLVRSCHDQSVYYT